MSSQIYYKRGKNCPKPPSPPPPPPPKKKKIKFDFCKIKKNTICSLNEVECFLNKFHKICNSVKLYKILK